MRLTDRVYLVGGGTLGFGISHEIDCHVYLIDGGREMALIDCGAGVTIEPIIRNIQRDSLDPGRLKYLLLTHAHADHAGAAFEWHERFGVAVAASKEAAEYVRTGDEERISLAIAKRGGFYPQDYIFNACPVDRVLADGDVFRVGDIELKVIETPGHCSGMLSFVLKESETTLLFDGDTVFHDGKLLITNVWDCNLHEYVRSIGNLAALAVDALLPGHLTISLSQGARHIQKAWDTLEHLVVPPNIL
ncbi:MAG: MBL fold metallo-hydrolase [Acidobacteriota bacterium]|nr:MBL fold metallo-hydrolase [Acidobacteriota bacterium]